jgi:hypothetical protein
MEPNAPGGGVHACRALHFLSQNVLIYRDSLVPMSAHLVGRRSTDWVARQCGCSWYS